MQTLLRSVAAAAALAAFVPDAALANECEDLVGGIKKLIDRVDPGKAKSETQLCAMLGEGIGLMRIFRIVSDECLPTGDKRISTLADLDRSIRHLQAEADKQCQ
jgi:hypothetical protein